MLLTVNDRDLHRDVLEALEFEPKVSIGAIGIAVELGVVTLSGTVHSFAEKWAAETATRRVKGVRGIANEIKVDLPGMHRYDDADIAKTAVEFLQWDVFQPKTIVVSVENGIISLSGTVPHHFQKRDAQEALGRLTGVRSIINNIEVLSGVEPKEIAKKIDERFQRGAHFDAQRIFVQTKDGKVKLTGEVRSLAERDEALNAAWSVPGVFKVDDDLTVVF